MAKDNPRDISIEKDGVKIGWNIMVTLATMAIGMYMYTVLAPLKSDLSSLSNTLASLVTLNADTNKKIARMNADIDDRLDSLEITEAINEGRVQFLERKHSAQ